jgi:hypothetical protein
MSNQGIISSSTRLYQTRISRPSLRSFRNPTKSSTAPWPSWSSPPPSPTTLHPSNHPTPSNPLLLYSPLLELMSKKNAPPRFFSSLSQLESDSNMMNRDFSKLDRKKLQYEDIIKVKWKTIQYVVDNKKPQMDMLTRNMRELINEVK